MRLLSIIAVSGHEGELLNLAVASAEREGVSVALLEGDAPHGAKLDAARQLSLTAFDAVIAMDSDCVVWPGCRSWIEQTLRGDVVACGAPRVDDPAGLHPSMLVTTPARFLAAPSFLPTPGQDVGVAVCRWLETQGRMHRAGAFTSHEGWWCYIDDGPVESHLWWHLGSGSQYPQPRDHVELGQWADSTDPWFQQSAAFAVRREHFLAKAREGLYG